MAVHTVRGQLRRQAPLKFLDKGKYTVQIYADAADAGRQPKNVSITSRVVDNTMSLTFHLAPGGGYAARFVRLPE